MMKVNMRPELMPSTRAEKSCEGLQRVQLGGIVMFSSFMPASISDCRRNVARSTCGLPVTGLRVTQLAGNCDATSSPTSKQRLHIHGPIATWMHEMSAPLASICDSVTLAMPPMAPAPSGMCRRYYAVYGVGHKHRHAIGCGDAYCRVVERCHKCVHALKHVVVDGQAVDSDAVD